MLSVIDGGGCCRLKNAPTGVPCLEGVFFFLFNLFLFTNIAWVGWRPVRMGDGKDGEQNGAVLSEDAALKRAEELRKRLAKKKKKKKKKSSKKKKNKEEEPTPVEKEEKTTLDNAESSETVDDMTWLGTQVFRHDGVFLP